MGDLGLPGAGDAGTGKGDSGGPWFVHSPTGMLIDATTRSNDSPLFGSSTDVDWWRNDSFGESFAGVRINPIYGEFIQPTLNAAPYDLVFDMKYQLFGRSDAPGAAQNTPENLVIEAQTVNGELRISVTNLLIRS